ncbi:hypothetical protein J437_LFUL008923 [Ladona fulva]|uniref:Vitamin K-dependent protein C n=1 Tax=Ladona fulva TaxID=123851 RepID=A0A8K0KCV3_LADFU|nr:hypothetical protein J437_LFUL008923 [Ladona fulva]
MSYSGMTGIVTGWGKTSEGAPTSNFLQEVQVPIYSNAQCKSDSYYGSTRITDNMMCAGYKSGSKDSCQGDSGGPMQVDNNGSYEIVGVVSWGEGCARPGYPGVYTRVNRYLTWIEKKTNGSCFCTP